MTREGDAVITPQHFDAHDTRGLPPLNLLKWAWDRPLSHEDPTMDEERRLRSVAQFCRDYMQRNFRERIALFAQWHPQANLNSPSIQRRLVQVCAEEAHHE